MTTDEIKKYIADQIDSLIKRPLMYGGDLNGIEAVFLTLLDVHYFIGSNNNDPRITPGAWGAYNSKHFGGMGCLTVSGYLHNKQDMTDEQRLSIMLERIKSFWEQYKHMGD